MVDLGIMHEQVNQQIRAGAELTLDYIVLLFIAGAISLSLSIFSRTCLGLPCHH
jgi:predicted HTH domain antitoxin